MVSGSVFCEKACSDGPSRTKSLTYRSIPVPEGSRDWTLAKSKYQPEDLGLIPCGVVRPDLLRFGHRWDRSRARSWLYFAFDGDFLVDRGNLATSFRRLVGVDGSAITDSWPCGFHPIPGQH